MILPNSILARLRLVILFLCGATMAWAQSLPEMQRVDGPPVQYLESPPSTYPLKGLLPQGGVAEHPGWGYLKMPESNLINTHQVDFESREVHIYAYYYNTLSKDSLPLWSSYYQELATYTFDMYDIGLQNLWLRSLIGQKDGGSEAVEGSFFDISIPVNMPTWMKDLGLDKPKLQLQGQMDIRLHGKGVYDDASGSYQKSLWPSPQLTYEPSFLVKGKVGRNITVEVNNTESGLGVRNQLRVVYAESVPGEFEDYILQRLELGSTSLSLKGTELTGYSENHQGLFGIKADWKIGDWNVTTVASQDGGSTEKYTLRASEQNTEYQIQDKQFVAYRHYFLTHEIRDQHIALGIQGRNMQMSQPTGLKLFKRSPLNNENDVYIEMTAVYQDNSDGALYEQSGLRLVEMKSSDWEWDRRTGTIHVKSANRNTLIAASWAGDLTGRTSGTVRNGQKVVLIQFDNTGANLPNIDKLMLRNIYSVGISQANASSFQLRMKDQNQRSGTFLKTLGVVDSSSGAVLTDESDIFPRSGSSYSGELWLPCRTLEWYRDQGYSERDVQSKAVENCLEPLRNIDSTTAMNDLYDKPVHKLNRYTSRFYFETVGKKRMQSISVRDPNSSYSVSSGNCIDIAPGSEKLKIGSDVLTKDVDYSVNYELGTIELISDRALNPNNEVEITYECEPLFEIDNKVLLGARAEYPLKRWGLGENSLLGFTALYKSQSTTQQQPQFGSEPFSSFLLGGNFRFQDSARWMNRFINLLPFIDTDKKSSWSVEGEIAASYHDANTSDKKSALVDDFEASSRGMQYSTYRTYWYQASPPGGVESEPGTYISDLDYRHQGTFIWHSNQDERYRNIYTEIGNNDVDSRLIPILKFTLRPNDNLEGKSWGGVMRANSQYWQDLSDMRYIEVVARGNVGQLFIDLGAISEDLSVNGYEPNQELNTEARLGTTLPLHDFGLDGIDGETGKETRLEWDCRTASCVSTEITSDGSNTDIAMDNFDEQEDDTDPTVHINGTEGNNGGDETRYDTEDLDRNSTLDLENRFVRYKIDLEDTKGLVYDDLKNGWRRWRISLDQFDSIISESGGTWEEILADARMTRIWYGRLKPGVSEGQVQIVELSIVGNQWEEELSENQYGIVTSGPQQVVKVDGQTVVLNPPGTTIVPDTNYLHVRVINNRDDAATYYKSPNTITERDAETNAALKEQSLVLTFGGLHPSQQVSATRIFDSESKDFTMYEDLKMEIHFESPLDSVPVRFALQFGYGSLDGSDNYYEWSFRPRQLHCGASERLADCHERNWFANAFDLPLDEFVTLKNGRKAPYLEPIIRKLTSDSALARDEQIKLVGNPSLGRINWVRFVIIADEEATQTELNGTFWVNDLRLSGMSTDWGLAGRLRGQMNFADVMTVSGEMKYQDGDFATMSSEGSSPKPTLSESETQLRLNSNFSFMLHKFFDDEYGLKIPLSLGYNTSVVRPYLKPSSDENLTHDDFWDMMSDLIAQDLDIKDSSEEAKLRSGPNPESKGYQDLSRTRSMSISYSKDHKKDNSAIKEFLSQTFLERPAFNYRYSETEMRGPLQADSNYTYNATLEYKLGTYEPFKIKPFKEKKWAPKELESMTFEPWPQTFDLVLFDFTYAKSISQERDADFVEPLVDKTVDYATELQHKASIRWSVFPFLNINYSLNIERDMEGDRTGFTKEHLFSSEDGGLLGSHYVFDYDHSDRKIYTSIDSFIHVENISKRSPRVLANGDTVVYVAGDTSTYVPYYTDIPVYKIDSVGHREYGRTYGILRNERHRDQDFKVTFTPAAISFLPMRIIFGSDFTQDKTIPDNFSFYDEDMRDNNFWTMSHSNRFEFNPTLRLKKLFGIKGSNSITKFLDKLRWQEIRAGWSVDMTTTGEDFTLAQLYEEQGVTPAQYYLYSLGLGNGFRNRGFWNIVSGDMGLDDPSDYENFAEYRSRTVDTTVYQSSFIHTVSRKANFGTSLTLPFWKIGVTGDLAWSQEFMQYRETPLYLDTTEVWPKASIGISVPNFVQKIGFLKDKLSSLSLNHRSTYEQTRTVHAFQSTEDEWKYKWDFAPLLRVSATTPKGIRIENAFNLMWQYTLRRPKVQVITSPTWPDTGSTTDTSDYYFDTPWIHTDSNEVYTLRIGNDLSISYDLKTTRGFQFMKWYFRLKNDINLKLLAGFDFERIQYRDRPIVAGYQPLVANEYASDVAYILPSGCVESASNCYYVYNPVWDEEIVETPTRTWEFHVRPSLGYKFSKMASTSAWIEYRYIRELLSEGGSHNVQVLQFEIALLLRFD